MGNQLQQYALYRKFIKLGTEALLDISWFTEQERQNGAATERKLELDFFEGLRYRVCTEEEKRKLTGTGGLAGKLLGKLLPGFTGVFRESGMYHPEIFSFRDKYLCGYWACEKYYADILKELQEQIRFPTAGGKNRETARRMETEESVSVHIRRGDYLNAENAAMFGNICTDAYYDGALREIRKRFPNARFYLFSDDPAYIRERYSGEEFTAVDWNRGKDSFYDMWLMSRCRHNICANSTFSFWGARLNPYPEKVMIRPSVHKNSQVFEADRIHELWQGWTLIDNRGEVR